MIGGAGCGTSESDKLAGYLEEVKVQQDRFLETQNEISAATTTVIVDDPGTWIGAAALVRRSRSAFNDVSAELAAIEPPEDLESAHAGLVRSVQIFSEDYDLYQAALRSGDTAQMQSFIATADARTSEAVSLRGTWRTAVAAAAKQQEVDVPAWVNRVGTRG